MVQPEAAARHALLVTETCGCAVAALYRHRATSALLAARVASDGWRPSMPGIRNDSGNEPGIPEALRLQENLGPLALSTAVTWAPGAAEGQHRWPGYGASPSLMSGGAVRSHGETADRPTCCASTNNSCNTTARCRRPRLFVGGVARYRPRCSVGLKPVISRVLRRRAFRFRGDGWLWQRIATRR